MTYEDDLNRIDSYIDSLYCAVNDTLGIIAEDLQELHCRQSRYNLVVMEEGLGRIALCPQGEDYDDYYHIRIDYSLTSGDLHINLGFNDSSIKGYIENNKYCNVLNLASEQYKRKKQELHTVEKHIAEEARTMRALQNSVKCTYL